MEAVLQYVWQHRLWESEQMKTTDGRKVLVLNPGTLNTDAGPDFFNAKIRVDDTTWVGNVEIHVRSGDWKRHRHDLDSAYDSVMLHVVETADDVITRTDGSIIPQVELKVSPRVAECLQRLNTKEARGLTCRQYLPTLPSIVTTEWLEALAFERLQAKVNRLHEWQVMFNGSWQDVCYVTVARALGMGVNSDAFERLARRTPLRLLSKHSDSVLQLEALLLGQAGLLDMNAVEGYAAQLAREYAFLRNKFSLTPMESGAWKLFRMRPHNFPMRRIALLARIIHGGFGLMSDIVAAGNNVDKHRQLFAVPLDGYWASHFTLHGEETAAVGNKLSDATVNVLLINAVAPLLYAYGEFTGEDSLTDAAIDLLMALPAERNSVVTTFTQAGLPCSTALDSQALIWLRRAYCETGKCMYCRFGHRMLRRAATQ